MKAFMHTTLFWYLDLLVPVIVVVVVDSTTCTGENGGKTIVEEDDEDVETSSVGLICAIMASSVLQFSVVQHKTSLLS